jgi:hypothetical protein
MTSANSRSRKVPIESLLSITTTHKLLTTAWTADLEIVEAAIERFAGEQPLTNECQVRFFELLDDRHLHVNVTHRHQTVPVRGWAGPASLPEGFVNNRRFGDMQPIHMIRHIRDMVFAKRA